MGVRIAVLRGAAEHVAKPRRRVGRLQLPFEQILEPLHAQGVGTHGRIADGIFVAGHADQSFVPLHKMSVMRPCSAIVAFSVVTRGPARMARAILTARICSSRAFAAPSASGKAIAALL
jgi:hypothetical protein